MLEVVPGQTELPGPPLPCETSSIGGSDARLVELSNSTGGGRRSANRSGGLVVCVHSQIPSCQGSGRCSVCQCTCVCCCSCSSSHKRPSKLLFLGVDALAQPIHPFLEGNKHEAITQGLKVTYRQGEKVQELTWMPSPERAEHAWICQMRSRMVCRLSPSAISEAGAAVSRSCLLAKMRTGTPLSFSSSSSSASS